MDDGRAEPERLFRALVETVFHGRNLDALDRLLAPDFVDHGAPPGTPPGSAPTKAAVAAFLAAFPDLRQEVDLLVVAGDTVTARSTFRGTHGGPWLGVEATGQVVAWTGITIMRVAGGRFVERWANSDDLGLSRQLAEVRSPPG